MISVRSGAGLVVNTSEIETPASASILSIVIYGYFLFTGSAISVLNSVFVKVGPVTYRYSLTGS
ncbi:hypothetical protein D3C84_940790 [compost metagenome]